MSEIEICSTTQTLTRDAIIELCRARCAKSGGVLI